MKYLLFYTVAGTIIGVALPVMGAGIGVTLMASLVAPPVLLLAFLIYRYKTR